jgi:hypothetical protein
MSFNMGFLLAHSEQLPIAARAAIREAQDGARENRVERLEAAARILHREIGVPCSDVRELLDLQPGDCGGS